jgi:hypothetical protein
MICLKRWALPVLFVVASIVLFYPATAYGAGTTYYVDAVSGNNSNNGLSPTSPWKTVSKVKSTTLLPGDRVLFKRGGVWREELSTNQSGTAGNPITFSAYGQGAKPLFYGSDTVINWSSVDPTRWSASVTLQPKMVLFDNVLGTQVTSLAALNAPGTWYWSTNTLYVYATANPATLYTNPGVEAAVRNGGQIYGKHYITVLGLDFTKGKYGIWYHGGAKNGTIVNVEASYNGLDGIAVSEPGTDNTTVTDSVSHDNVRNGLLITGGAANTTVSGGAYYNNTQLYSQGVGVNLSSSAVISGVTAYNNYYGIKAFGTTTSNITFANNTSYSNRSFGIDVDTAGAGIVVEGNHSGGWNRGRNGH